MLGVLSRRVLPVLQLTRMALVFTAVSNGLCALALSLGPGARPDAWVAVAVVVTATGLYGLGMSLNDIIDHRRDRSLAPQRPLPSGRLGVRGAHLVAGSMAAAALSGGVALAAWTPRGAESLALLLLTGSMVLAYDFAARWFVTFGLLTLGAIRFSHALIAAPEMPLLWHPLLLMNHVVVVSAVAHRVLDKRPPFSRRQVACVVAGLACMNAAAIAGTLWRRGEAAWQGALAIDGRLLAPIGAAAGFVLLVGLLRAAGLRAQGLITASVLWLIVYDAAFAGAYVGAAASAALLALLPATGAAVIASRWWSRLVLLSQKPQYQRAR